MKGVTKIQVKGSGFISKSEHDKLLSEHDKLLSEHDKLLSEHDKLLSDYQDIKHQLEELKRLIFGRKSERHITQQDNRQLSLFDQQKTKPEKDNVKEEVSYTRTKSKKDNKKAIRKSLPAHLPRKKEIIEPKNLPKNAKKIGEEITEILEYTPQKIYVRQIIRPKYVVLDEEKSSSPENLSTQIIISDLPSLPLPKSNAGASLLSYIIVSKFVDHLPFYRLISILKREEIQISQSTMGGWFSNVSDLLRPLYEALMQALLDKARYLSADESPI